jgi:hypothetical protein
MKSRLLHNFSIIAPGTITSVALVARAMTFYLAAVEMILFLETLVMMQWMAGPHLSPGDTCHGGIHITGDTAVRCERIYYVP